MVKCFYLILYYIVKVEVVVDGNEEIRNLVNYYKRKIFNDYIQRVNIEREILWEDIVVFFKIFNFDFLKCFRVKFEDEEGIDDGGFWREYFIFLMKVVVKNRVIFEG